MIRLVDGDAVDQLALATSVSMLRARPRNLLWQAASRPVGADRRCPCLDPGARGAHPEPSPHRLQGVPPSREEVYHHVSLFRHSDGTALGIVDGRRITSLVRPQPLRLRSSTCSATPPSRWV